MLEKNRSLTFEQIRTRLQQSARTDGIPAAEVPAGLRRPEQSDRHPVERPVGRRQGQRREGARRHPAPRWRRAAAGGGGPVITLEEVEWGYTPHTIFSRLADWQRRYGARPGLMLVAALVSEHVDEVLRLINHNPRVAAVWRRGGGPELVRHLLHGPPARPLLPAAVEGHAVAGLLERLLPVLDRFGGPRLRGDIARFARLRAALAGGRPRRARRRGAAAGGPAVSAGVPETLARILGDALGSFAARLRGGRRRDGPRAGSGCGCLPARSPPGRCRRACRPRRPPARRCRTPSRRWSPRSPPTTRRDRAGGDAGRPAHRPGRHRLRRSSARRSTRPCRRPPGSPRRRRPGSAPRRGRCRSGCSAWR